MKDSSEEKLDLVISYILIIGVVASVAIEGAGIISYNQFTGNLNVLFQPEYALKGTDFFSYTLAAFQGLWEGNWSPFQILSLGVILLMITPYIRVVASVIYFALARNVKYLFITLLVFVILTASLLTH